MTRDDNPFVVLRRAVGLGQADFARALGVSLPSLWAAESGTTARPSRLFRALRAMGYDAADLAQVYARWRAGLVDDERRRLQAKLADGRLRSG